MTASAIPLTEMDHAHPALLADLMAAVERVASTGAFIGGSAVEQFEDAFAVWCEAPHAVGVSSGTEALTLTLRALGLARGDQVIVPANSFVATAEAVWLAGGVPRFADVDPDTQLVTAATVAAAHTPSVRGVIPVHLFGRTVDMRAVTELAGDWGVWVLEDCAQAHGARFDGRPVGSWGVAGTFSFYPAKNLGAWGDAGAVVTHDQELAEQIRLLRSHGERPRYHHRTIGTTGRLDALQAAVLERKLAHLDGWNDARRRVAGRLRAAIRELEYIAPPPDAPPPGDHVYHQFVVRTEHRDELRHHLERRDIASAVHYPIPIHRSEAFAEGSHSEDPAPTATRLAGEICSLPLYPAMSDDQIERVAGAVAEFDADVAPRLAA